jgi:tetratricopeptide (TPR) repeat protein
MFFISHHNLKIVCPDVRDLFNRAAELAEYGQSDGALALVNKGIILFRMCRYQDALNSFAQAADNDLEFNEVWYNKRMALMCSGKYL